MVDCAHRKLCVCACVGACGAERQAGGVVQQQWEGSQKHSTAEERMVQSPITHARTNTHILTEREAQILSGECEPMLRQDVRGEEGNLRNLNDTSVSFHFILCTFRSIWLSFENIRIVA